MLQLLQVDVAEDGAEGLVAAKNRNYIAILTDGYMPVMTGWEMTREIRKHENQYGLMGGTGETTKNDCSSARAENLSCNNPASSRVNSTASGPVVIIGVTGTVGAEDARACRECGMTDVLPKPVDRAGLARTIRRWTVGNAQLDSGRDSGQDQRRSSVISTCESEITATDDDSDSLSVSVAQEPPAPSSNPAIVTMRRVLVLVAEAPQKVVIKGLFSTYRAGGGVDIVFVSDGPAAQLALDAEAAAGKCFDAVMLDIELSGSAAATNMAQSTREKARAAGHRCPVFVAILRGPGTGTSVAGFDAVLCRPLRAEPFHGALRRRLSSGLQRFVCIYGVIRTFLIQTNFAKGS